MIPITMVGRLDVCYLLTYVSKVESVKNLLPVDLELVTVRDHAFWNIVVCNVQKMRPCGLPVAMGLDYWHIAYRLQVSGRVANGKVVQGLWFARSDVDNSLIAGAGKQMTDFKFHSSRIRIQEEPHFRCEVQAEGANAVLEVGAKQPMALRDGSLFASLEEREQAIKYQPFGLSVDAGGSLRVAKVERDESTWKESEVDVREARWEFLEGLGQRDLVLERATTVEPIDYCWRLGGEELLE